MNLIRKNLSFGESVIASLKIESEHDSSKAVLVDLAPFLVSDIADMSEFMKQSFRDKPVRFDKDRSALTTVKAYPENVEIEALLTYSPNDRTNFGLPTVPDDRYIPVTIHYSFSKLPEKPMLPRLATACRAGPSNVKSASTPRRSGQPDAKCRSTPVAWPRARNTPCPSR